jgi:hypothetical protein
MNNELPSKQTFKITLTCQSALPLISLPGVQKVIQSKTLGDLLKSLASMHHDYVDLRVIQTEVEEVSPSPKLPMQTPSNTKESSTKKTIFVTSAGKVVPVGSKSPWHRYMEEVAPMYDDPVTIRKFFEEDDNK